MKLILLILVLLFQFSAFAQDAVIAVGQAEQDKDKLVIDDPELNNLTSDQKRLAAELTEIVRNDFVFYKEWFTGYFEYVFGGVKNLCSCRIFGWGRVTSWVACNYDTWICFIRRSSKIGNHR